MSEVNFLAFCITVIAITAIAYGKDKLAEKALSTLSQTAVNLLSVIGKVFCQTKHLDNSNDNKIGPFQDEVKISEKNSKFM